LGGISGKKEKQMKDLRGLKKALKAIFGLKHIILLRVNKEPSSNGRYIAYTITFETRYNKP